VKPDAAAYRAASMTAAGFHGRKFKRLKQLRFLLESRKLDTALDGLCGRGDEQFSWGQMI